MRTVRRTLPDHPLGVSTVIEQHMTLGAFSIGAKEPLSAAYRLMQEHEIRHLPVVDGGELVGMLSLRDLHLLETFGDTNPDEIPVADAMATDVYAVPPHASLAQVCETMAERKIGSAVVMEREVVGIFTTTDALRATAWLARGY
jgi:acetoin utilization protein AcuB